MAQEISNTPSILRSCAIFAPLTSEAMAVLAAMMRPERFAAGETVCEMGERADCVYVVATGELTVTLPGRAMPVRHLGTGDILGEYGMFGRRERSSTVRAL